MSKHYVSHTEEYPVPIEAFYAAIVDYPAYPGIIEPIREIEVLKKTRSGARVRFGAHYFRDVHYTLDLTHHKPYEVSWELVNGDAFKHMSGAWELEAIDEGLTRVRYEAEVALHVTAPGFIVRRALRNSLPTMMDAFFEHAQSLGKRGH